jgi:hypothetical protein
MVRYTGFPMASSNHYKKYENPEKPNRNSKGRKKPVAIRNARKRRSNLKSKYCSNK